MNNPSQSELKPCGKCGAVLEEAAAGGLCTRCVLEAVLAPPSEDSVNHELERQGLLFAGRALGAYEIIEEIARGGMGVVFRARQRRPDRLVALKVIAAGEMASVRMVERFHAETEAAARLDHPNIASIYEVGAQDGWHFFSMRLINGPTLGQKLAHGPLVPKEAAALFVKIARAVHHAHERGVLHRDIKPNNILLDEDGEPYLTDFGLAKILEADSSLTLSNAVLGTPAYMPPEQASGHTRDVTVTADVYSLGAVFYEMLAGRPPFSASSTPALLRLIVEQEPAPPSQLLRRTKTDSRDTRAIPSELDVICLKCLEKSPGRRYANAAELADDVERWRKHEPIRARPAGTWERCQKWVRRHPAASVAAGMALLALLFLSVAAALFTIRLNRARGDAEKNAAAARAQVMASRLSEAGRLNAEGDAFAAILSLTAALRETAGNKPVETEIWNRINTAIGLAPRLLRVWAVEGKGATLRFGQNDAQLSAVYRDGSLRTWDLRRNIERTYEKGSNVTHTVLSADGNQAAQLLKEAPFVRVWDTASFSEIPLQGLEEPATAVAFRPDGREVAVAGKSIQWWDARTGEQRPGKIDISSRVKKLQYAPEGESVLAIDQAGKGVIHNLRSGKSVMIPVSMMTEYIEPEFSPNGQWLLAPHRSQIALLDTRTWVTNATFRSTLALDAHFSPDGKQFALAGFNSQAGVWNTRTGVSIGYRFEHESGANKALFSPDNRWLLTAGFDDLVKLRWLDAGSFGALTFHQGALLESAAFSSNGRFLATANALGLVQVWDLNPGATRYVPNGVVTGQALVNGRVMPLVGDRSIHFWDAVLGLETQPSLAMPGRPYNVEFARGTLLGSFGAAGARFWDVRSQQEILHLTAPEPVVYVSLSPDASRALLAFPDGWLRLVEVPSGKTVGPPLIDIGRKHLESWWEWSADSRWLVTGRSHVQAWNAKTGEQVGEKIECPFGIGLPAISPSGNQLLLQFADPDIEPSYAQLYSLPSMQPAGPKLRHSDGVTVGKFSPNGKIVATGGQDNVVRFWHAADSSPVGHVLRHVNEVMGLAFSGDGRLLVSGSRDGFLRIWDAARGEMITPPLRIGTGVDFVGFSEDNQFVVTKDAASHLLVIKIHSQSPILGESERLAVCASGLEATERGAGNPLEAREVASRFAALVQDQPGAFSWPDDSFRWHQEAAAQAESLERWPLATFHLRHLIRLKPDDSSLPRRLQRAEANIR